MRARIYGRDRRASSAVSAVLVRPMPFPASMILLNQTDITSPRISDDICNRGVVKLARNRNRWPPPPSALRRAARRFPPAVATTYSGTSASMVSGAIATFTRSRSRAGFVDCQILARLKRFPGPGALPPPPRFPTSCVRIRRSAPASGSLPGHCLPGRAWKRH